MGMRSAEWTDWRARGVRLDDGQETELAIRDGCFADRPASAAEVLPGRYLLAGLVDAHVHAALDLGGPGRPTGSADVIAESLRSCLHAGVLLARDAGAPAGVRLGGDHAEGPEILASGRFLAPPGRYLEGLFEGVTDEDLAAVAEEELSASRSGWVKLVFDFPEQFTGPASFSAATANYAAGTVRSLCDRVHALGGRVAAHVSGPGDAAAAVGLGVDSLEHGPDVPLESLAVLGRRGGAWTPTVLTVWRDGLSRSPAAAGQRAHYRAAFAAALAAGVTILAGTDAAGAGALADEIALLADLGLSPADALAAGSSAARAYLGRPGFARGAPADLVTCHDDPREDPDVLRRPAAVLRRGARIR
jgi:imidazolonepropionase-like amidohydrolase